MKSKELIKFIDKEFPSSAAMEDDYVGAQVTFGDEEIKSVLVCLDLTLQNIKNAISQKVNFIISHHPLFFGEKDELIKEDSSLRIKHELLIENKITYYSLHTNLDFHKNGISIQQAKILGIGAIRPMTELNEGAFGSLKIKKEALVKKLKNVFGIENMNVYFHKNSFNKVSIASGASGYLIQKAKKMQCDVLIVGEVKWHEWVWAKENNISLVEIGHFTEGIFIHEMVKMLKSQVNSTIAIESDQIFTMK